VGGTPEEGFFNNTGYHTTRLSELLKSIVAALLFLWSSFVVLSSWRLFHSGAMTIKQLQVDSMRAVVILMVSIALIS
jgi:integrating conjugative element protein (TIGR03758 family)